jgi:hypothetical protein
MALNDAAAQIAAAAAASGAISLWMHRGEVK